MANFTIHDLYSSMSGNVTALDYRNKNRNDWTAWDWLCALKDGLNGDAAGARFEQIDHMKAELQALFDLKNELPGLTEAEMMGRFGKRMRTLFLDLLGEPIQAAEPSLTDDELELINDATTRLRPDTEEAVNAGENRYRTAVRFRDFRGKTAEYLVRLIQEYRAEQDLPNRNEERMMALAARMFIASNLARNLQARAGRNFPESLNEEEIGRLADSMLTSDLGFRSAILTEINTQNIPDFGLQPAGQPQNDQNLNQAGQYMSAMADRIEADSPDNTMRHDPGENILPPDRAADRIALLKDVRAELDKTGTGYSWNHWFGRPNNSPQYEAVRKEINRQIERLEAGLPVGDADRVRMMQVLNAYSVGREDPGYGFAKTRQNNVLRLYAEYATPEERFNVERRYNRRRGTLDVNNSSHISLNRDPYRFGLYDRPNSALSLYNRALTEMRAQFNSALASGRPMNDTELFAFRQNTLRAAALREIIIKNRTGRSTPVREEDILAAQTRIEQDLHNPVAGAIGGAGRDISTMGEMLLLFENDINQDRISSLTGEYFRDPSHFEDPMTQPLKRMSFPTVEQLYRNAKEQLAALDLPQQGNMSQEQADEYSRLTRRIFALKQLMVIKGPQYHLSTTQQMNYLHNLTAASRIDQTIQKASQDPQKASAYRNILLDDTVTPPVLRDMTDRYANDNIQEAQDFFRNIQVPQNDLPLSEQDKQRLRDQFVHVAALSILFDPQTRSQRFPDRVFTSDSLFSSEEIASAEADVRQNQPAFMQAIEAGLTTAGGVKQLFESLATQRYATTLGKLQADHASYRQTQDPQEKARLKAEIHEHFAALTALKRLQIRSGCPSIPVTDKQLADEIVQAKVSDEYLAAERMIRSSDDNITTLIESFSHPETLSESFNTIKNNATEVAIMNHTIGAAYAGMQSSMLSVADYTTPEGRSVIALNFAKTLAYRQMVLDHPDGMYAPEKMDEFTQRQVAIVSDPRYSELFNRIRDDHQAARDVLTTILNESGLYQLKVAQKRARARGEEFEDPMITDIRRVAALRYQEIFNMGMQQYTKLLNGCKAGVPLTQAQKNELLNAAALMVIGRQAPDRDSQKHMMAEDRVRRQRELTAGLTDESRDLIAVVDRLAQDGGKVANFMEVAFSELGEINDAVHSFTVQTPAKWADDAWDKLQAAVKIDHPNGWTAEEKRDLMNTYACMIAMRELAKDPEAGSKPISLPSVRLHGENYLNAGTNRMGLEVIFSDPVRAVIAQTLSGRITALLANPPEAHNKEMLQQMIALKNLQAKYSDNAIVDPNEIIKEMAKVSQSVQYIILTDPRNPKVPAIDPADLNTPTYQAALETAVINSPIRRDIILNGAPENSYTGLRNIFTEELRHDQVLNSREAEALHLAELYVISLYQSDPNWKEGSLPDPKTINEQAIRITAIPDFKAAMRHVNGSPEKKAALIQSLTSGAPVAQITESLNIYAQTQRNLENEKDIRKADLHYDIRSALVQKNLALLQPTDNNKNWPTDEDRRKAVMAGSNHLMLSKEEAKETYLRFLTDNRLYMQDPGRYFFTPEETAAMRQQVEEDPEVQKDLETVLNSPQDMRLNVYNLAPSQYWTEIKAMEDGRDLVLNRPEAANKLLGLQMIMFSLVPIAESRLKGNDIQGRVIPDGDLNETRNRLAFTEDFICIENALRNDINELDRIKDVLKLPSDQFPEAFRKLTDEYKEKYKEVEIPDKDTLAGEYKQAKDKIKDLKFKSFAYDERARKDLAHNIREVMTIRNIILTSHYDVSLKRNSVTEAFTRREKVVRDAEQAGKHHIDMYLGTPEQLEESLKDPEVAQKYLSIMDGAEDLRRLYGKKLEAGTEITDPLEQQIIDHKLNVDVPSHQFRQQTTASRLIESVPDETPQQRSARIRMQVAALFNLTLHAEGTDPKDMPSDEVLAEQAAKITQVKDFQYAADRLAKDPQKLTDFMNKALTGMTAEEMAKELDNLSAEEQRALDPAVEPLPNVMYRLKRKLRDEANEGIQESASHGGRSYWLSKGERDKAQEGFMHYTAVNRLMEKHPYRVYFSPAEIQASFIESMNDQVLQEEYQVSVSKNGPNGLRKDLFSYAGSTLLTAEKYVDNMLGSIADPRETPDEKESSIEATVLHFELIARLHREGLSEKNHFAGDIQPEVFGNFPNAPEFKAIKAACMLDHSQVRRFASRLMPLRGQAYADEYKNVIEECQAPVNTAELNKNNVAQLKKYMRLAADAEAGKDAKNTPAKRYRLAMRNILADTLALSMYAGLPAQEKPNAEALIKMREQIKAFPEFKAAKKWLDNNPEEMLKLVTDIEKGLRPSQLISRFNEAAAKQQLSEDPKAKPSPNIAFRMQRQMMEAQQREMFRKNILDNNTYKPNGKENLKKEFLDFCALDDLCHRYPHRVAFSAAEIRAARQQFEKNEAFMQKLDETLKSPITARNDLIRFRSLNNWMGYAAAEQQLSVAKRSLESNPGTSDEERAQLYQPAIEWLVQTAISKMDQQQLYYPGMDMAEKTHGTMEDPGFAAMGRAIQKDPKHLDRIINELFPLQGGDFLKKYDELSREYRKDFPVPKVKRRAVRNAGPQPRPAQQPENIILEDNRSNIQGEPKDIIRDDNKIIIHEEPKKVINEPKPLPRVKLTPPLLVVPESRYKKVPAMGQFQRSAAQLEETLYMQKASNIPIKDAAFLKAAYQGILKTVAYRNLAARPEYAEKKVDKNALNAEVDRLKNDPQLQALPDLIEQGKANTVLEGIKKIQGDPAGMEQFLKSACQDPDAAGKALNAKFPEPAPRYRQAPELHNIKIKTDMLPAVDQNRHYDPESPMGRYLMEQERFKNMREDAKYGALKFNYEIELKKHLTAVYGMRQIIASSEDPTVIDKELNSKLYYRTQDLDKDDSFQNIVKACQKSQKFTNWIQKNLQNTASFTDLNNKLQHDSEGAYRLEIREENKKIDQENEKLKKNAEIEEVDLQVHP